MNEIVRTAAMVAGEINTIKAQTQVIVLQASVEIGRRLVEAKELVAHGEWGAWLSKNVDYSVRTAQNMMRLCEEYGEGELPKMLAEIPYSKALALIAVPEEEREEVAAASEDMSTRELEELTRLLAEERERNAATAASAEELKEKLRKQKEDVAAAKNQAEKAQKDIAAAQKKADEEKARAGRLEKELEKARSKETVTVEVIPPDVEGELRRLRELEKKAPNEEVIKFRSWYEEWQTKLERLVWQISVIETVDKELAAKYRKALRTACEKVAQGV